MNARRSALIVAYNFPPHGAVGTLRTLRLVRQLAAEGWTVAVLTGAPSTYLPGDSLEPSLVPRIPDGVEVARQRAIRPIAGGVRRLRRLFPKRAADAESSQHAPVDAGSRSPGLGRRLIGLVDALTSLPDEESGWFGAAVLRGVRLSLRRRPDVIYSTGPPWTAQTVGYALAALTGRPWVADFRDPWARAPWRERTPHVQLRSWRRLERLVVGRAQAVVFTTRAARDEFAGHYGPAFHDKLRVVPNGCDVADFQGIQPDPRPEFVLLHAGSLYGGRDPTPLLRAIAAAIRRRALDPATFRLRLLGAVAVAGVDLDRAIMELGLQQVVERRPAVARPEALREMRSASALLLVQPGHALSVPAKTYEYLAAGRPILALTDPGETARVVEESGVGAAAPASDVEAIEQALLRVMVMAASGVEPAATALYDGSQRARELAQILASQARPSVAGRESAARAQGRRNV